MTGLCLLDVRGSACYYCGVNLPRRIVGANCTVHQGVCVVSWHTTDPAEFLRLWQEHERPTLQEKVYEGIPCVVANIDGTGWRVTLKLHARTLSDMHVHVPAA